MDKITNSNFELIYKIIEVYADRLKEVEFRLACLELEVTNHKKEFKDHLDELISL